MSVCAYICSISGQLSTKVSLCSDALYRKLIAMGKKRQKTLLGKGKGEMQTSKSCFFSPIALIHNSVCVCVCVCVCVRLHVCVLVCCMC